MTVVIILLGATALGILIGTGAVYLTLTHNRDHNEGIW
jgi:hypothetical protein